MRKASVLIFGASGMLGSMVLDVLSQSTNIKVTATVRQKKQLIALSKKYKNVVWEELDIHTVEEKTLQKLVRKHQWCINAVGAIKPTIPNDSPEVIDHAVAANILFPLKLAKAIKRAKTRVIQIATDCVFAENKSHSIETDMHEPNDIYGKTKSLGEIHQNGYYNLRCSIIGPEIFNNRSLLAWFLGQKKNATVYGFTNHIWNGVTTLQFAKICEGIIKTDLTFDSLQHIIPKDEVTKLQLLHIFAKVFKRSDIVIHAKKAQMPVNRTLATIHDKMNKRLWQNAGYKKPPTIEEMVLELADYMEQRQILDRAK